MQPFFEKSEDQENTTDNQILNVCFFVLPFDAILILTHIQNKVT